MRVFRVGLFGGCVGLIVLLAALAPGARAQSPEATPSAPPAHAAGWSAADCAACHEPTITGMHGSAHASVQGQCATCHGDPSAHLKSVTETGEPGPTPSFRKKAPRDQNETCLTCHDKGRQSNWHGGMHERRQVTCIGCHSVHSAKSVQALLKTPRETETCTTCHTQIRSKLMRVSHHPVREGLMGCASCHDPHDGTKS